MKAVFFGILVILGAASIPACAEKNSSNSAPRNYQCLPVKDKKPWCACKSSISDSTIDLSSLGTEEGIKDVKAKIRPPKFVSKNDVKGWKIAWTPCEDFDVFANETLDPTAGEKACKEVGFARYTMSPPRICNGYGSHESSAHFYSTGHDQETGKEGYIIEFDFKTKEGIPRKAKISLECTKDSDENVLHYDKEKQGVEVATFSSKCCCENQPCRKKSPVHPKKIGMIAGIAVAIITGLFLLAVLAKVGIKKIRNRPGHPVQVDEPQEHDERQHLLI